MSRVSRRVVAAALALAPGGCSGLLPTGDAPPKLYTLTAATELGRGAAVPWQLLVDVPVSVAALDTERIALSRSPTTVDYFADAALTDRAPLMIQSLIVQSFENSGRISAIARESLALKADYVLRAELRRFEAEYGGEAVPSAQVRLAAKLVKMPERAISAQKSFAATARASQNQVPAIVEAFDGAFHQVVRQLVDWALGGGR